ncbi:glycosyltransferase [Pelagicoccus sp. SDUM812003]|uniref:glycosyltransferase n=1 Tax=Pelagicoccus sp. SDUM812003 TaxID=3041267 RepID=UPI0028108076|nr:glycosyltransferase [Pelagicoccus sp. SDUM812003]MDQ8203603.1 glycosyltransferase [Pelagicoccus sp. SDUM812003]
MPTSIGGSQRTNLLHRALSELGEVEMIVLSSATRYTEEQWRVMKDRFGLVGRIHLPKAFERSPWKYLPLPQRWKNKLGHNVEGSRRLLATDPRLKNALESMVDLSRYDVVVGRYARSIAALGLHENAKPPVVLDIDDWDPDKYRSRLSGKVSAWERLILGWHLRNIEKASPSVIAGTRAQWVSNPSNLEEPLVSRARLLPNIPFEAEGSDLGDFPLPEGKVLMTIGSYQHRPNALGVDWFLNEVWPMVVAAEPGATFRVYGSHLSSSMRDRWSRVKNVEVIGFVDTVEEAYRNAVATVCPVNDGAGTNIKILESLRHGRHCFSTTTGARGFDDLVEEDVVGAFSDAETMARAIVESLGNRQRLPDLGERGRTLVEERYSYAMFSTVVREGIEDALGRSIGGAPIAQERRKALV